MSYFTNGSHLNKMHNMPSGYGSPVHIKGASHHYVDSFSPNKNNNNNNNDLVSDDQLSFFEFEPRQSVSPFGDQHSTSTHQEIFPSWTDSNQHPLSPPNSALFYSPKARPFFEHHQSLPNILTSIDPVSTRAQYGQVTPPDDEEPNVFRYHHQQIPSGLTTQTASPKKGKKSTTLSKDLTGTVTPKRSRKKAARAGPLDGSAVDPSNPEQVRRSKFLERNRIAASKCRQKKKQWIDKTEAQARELHSHNASLQLLVESLRNEVTFLKAEMVRHMDCEGSSAQTFISQETDSFADAIHTYRQDQKHNHETDVEPQPKLEDTGAEPSNELENVLSVDEPSVPVSEFEDIDTLEALLTSELGQKNKKSGPSQASDSTSLSSW